MLVYPAHDYKGDTVSTIGEEKLFNPRLRVKSMDEYAELMNNLKLPNPKDDGCRGAGQHSGRPTSGRSRAQRVGSVRWRRNGAARRSDIALIDLREKASAKSTVSFRGRCTCPIRNCRAKSAPAACCMNWRASRTNGSCSIALRRTLGHGGSGGTGRWPKDRVSHCRRDDAWKKANGPLVH